MMNFHPIQDQRLSDRIAQQFTQAMQSGELTVGDDIMLVLIGGDIRPHVVDALQSLVGTIKNECVSEVEREA